MMTITSNKNNQGKLDYFFVFSLKWKLFLIYYILGGSMDSKIKQEHEENIKIREDEQHRKEIMKKAKKWRINLQFFLFFI